MKRKWTALLALLIAVGFAFTVFGQDEAERPVRQRRAEREEERPEMRPADRPDARRVPRMAAVRLLNVALETEEGKAIADDLAEKTDAMLEGLREDMVALREKVMEARREGADRDEIQAILEEAREESAEKRKEFISAQIEALKKLVAIIEENQDDLAEDLIERLPIRRGVLDTEARGRGRAEMEGRERGEREDRPRRRAE